MNTTHVVSKKLRVEILERDYYTCRYCGYFDPTGMGLEVDHVYPFSLGGATIKENLVTSCHNCNSSKYNHIGLWPNKINKSSMKYSLSLTLGEFSVFLAHMILFFFLPSLSMITVKTYFYFSLSMCILWLFHILYLVLYYFPLIFSHQRGK